jgi:phytoene dehydrogenase-like protein
MTSSASPAALPSRCDTIVVGAGLAGLSCARHLAAGGASVHVVDAQDGIGGRVRTDEVDGFRLDRGFQVLLTAYDEVWRLVDRGALDLGAFDPGSLVYTGGGLHPLADPFRTPSALAGALRSPVGSLGDKMRVARLRAELVARRPGEGLEGRPHSTLDELRRRGFGDDFIDTFFRPFLGGVFLDRSLSAPAALFNYLFRCFAVGDATLPAGGMGRLAEAIARPLAESITLGTRVVSLDATSVTTADGRTIQADRVVLATDGADASRLVDEEAPAFAATRTAWFAARETPVDRPVLVLDGEGTGPVNHLAVVSQVARGLAPEGWSLISASGVGPHAGEASDGAGTFAAGAVTQLGEWFGEAVRDWRHLHTHFVPRALPQRHPGAVLEPRPLTDGRGVYLAGDDREFAAIQGALRSGRRVAEAILAGRTGTE